MAVIKERLGRFSSTDPNAAGGARTFEPALRGLSRHRSIDLGLVAYSAPKTQPAATNGPIACDERRGPAGDAGAIEELRMIDLVKDTVKVSACFGGATFSTSVAFVLSSWPTAFQP